MFSGRLAKELHVESRCQDVRFQSAEKGSSWRSKTKSHDTNRSFSCHRLNAIYQNAVRAITAGLNSAMWKIWEAKLPSYSDNLIILLWKRETTIKALNSIFLLSGEIRWDDEFSKCLSHEKSSTASLAQQSRLWRFNSRFELGEHSLTNPNENDPKRAWFKFNRVWLYNSYIYPTTCQLKLHYKPNPPVTKTIGIKGSSSYFNMRNESI